MNVIAYYRVSTRQQGLSGLGLEAQKEIVSRFVKNSQYLLIGEYTEIETSTKDTLENRPILQKAIMHARRTKSILLIAKLDRLSRSVYVTSLLHKSGVEFIACDMPMANRLTIQIMAAIAEHEAKMISERTRASLAALKARGVLLGAHNPKCRAGFSVEEMHKGREKSNKVNHQKAVEDYRDLSSIALRMRQEGKTLKDIARFLNNAGHTTRTGVEFCPKKVSRLLTYC